MADRPRKGLVPFVALLLLLPSGATQGHEAEYARVNAALVEHQVLPRYEKLVVATGELDRAVTGLCRQSPPRDLAGARAAFGAALDAWMAVEHVRHGPVELFMRNFRFHFWPDKGGRGGRQLRALLSRRDDRELERGIFRTASVAVQGFPTAERLLFNEATARTIQVGADGDYPCRLLGAVASNLAEMATGTLANWSDGPKAFTNEVRQPGGTDARFATHKEATAAFVKGLHTSLQVIVDYRLDRPLGKTLQAARPRLAESWRSGHSLANIVTNLEALRAMYEGEGGPGLKSLLGPEQAELVELMSRAFAQTLATARSVDMPLAQAVAGPAARAKVEQLAKEVRALKELVGGRLAPALGTPLGFNALDGD